MYTVTAGRTFAWPFVLEKSVSLPIFGYGRDSDDQTGSRLSLGILMREAFPIHTMPILSCCSTMEVVGLCLSYRFIWLCSNT